MNPTRINTTPTTTSSKLMKNEFRYLPLMAATIDGVVPMSTSGSGTDLPAGATTAIAASSGGSLVHVIPVQLTLPVTSSTISGTSVNLATLCVDSNPMAPPLSILTSPSSVHATTGMQVHSHAIPLETAQFVHQSQHQAANPSTLSMPTPHSTNIYVNRSEVTTGYGRSDDISPISSSSIISQGIPINICNVSSAVTSSSSSEAAGSAPAAFIIPTTTTLIATPCCQITNALPTHNLNPDMVKKIVLGGANATNGTNTSTTTTSLIRKQLPPKQQQQQSHLNAPILKSQQLINTTNMNAPTIITSKAAASTTTAAPQPQKSAPLPSKPPQFAATTIEQKKVTPPPPWLENSGGASAKNQMLFKSTTSNKEQQISNKNSPSASSIPLNSNALQLKSNVVSTSTTTMATSSVCTEETNKLTTNIAALEPKSSLLIKNNKKDSTRTATQIPSTVTLTSAKAPSVIKATPEPANVTLEKQNISAKLQETVILKAEEKKLPAPEQKQKSLLKTMQRIIKEHSSPRAKRSKSLNNATVCSDLAPTQTTSAAATERRFSSPDTQHKTEIKPHYDSSSSTRWCPQKNDDTAYILIDDDDTDDDDRGDINQELAGFDEEYLDDTSADEKSSDASESKIEIVPSNVKKNSNEKNAQDVSPAALQMNENLVKNENLPGDTEIKTERVPIVDFTKNTVELEETKPKISINNSEIFISNEPILKCKQEIMEDIKTSICEDITKDHQEQQCSVLDKSLFCDEQLLVTSSSTSASSTSSASLKNASINESIKMNTSATTKSSTTQSSATSSSSSSASSSSSSASATLSSSSSAPSSSSSSSSSVPVAASPANSVHAGSETKNVDINSYSAVLGMLSTFNMLSWKERIGTARGTNLRFQLNEFNLLQVHERCQPRYRIHTAYEKPIYERESHSTENKDPLLYLCRRCNCHGPAKDFLAPEFCSLECLKRDSRKRQRDFTGTIRKRSRKDTIASAAPTAVAISTAASSSVSTTTAPLSFSNNSSSLLARPSNFRWSTYLTGKFGELAAPVNLFLNPFPTGPNNFKIGMKLEAIDPENCSLFCVCTVVDMQGYRLNLSFDGYDRMYNFWVNADSMDIFPPGWCAKTNRILQPPKGLDAAMFNWISYFVKEQAIPAPRQLFTHLNSSSLPTRNPFKVGMHLEAEDLNDTGKLCVATVADVLDERIRIHFDGWDDCYDYWVDTNSPYIHPCGWHEGRHQLVVPPDFENSAFSWSDYIKEHHSNLIAPAEIFAARDPIDFKPKMKLEVVDPRNPMLIRPATIVARKGHRVKIHLDQWPLDYCFWLEDDSPDLHPIGWCDATQHKLEPPPGYRSPAVLMSCSIVGCRGIGNAKVFSLNIHSTRDTCPYAPENWNIKIEKPTRVDGNEIERKITAKANLEQIMLSKQTRTETLKAKPKQMSPIPLPPPTTSGNNATVADDIIERLRLLDNIKTRRSLQEKLQQSNTPLQAETLAIEGTTLEKLIELKQELRATMVEVDEEKQKIETDEPVAKISKAPILHVPVDANAIKIAKEYLCDYGPRLQQNYNIWQQNLNFNCNDIKKNPLQWTTTECCLFVEKLLNLRTARTFANEDIDGAALLALQQSDLTDILELKLGPAVKLYAHILQLRTFHVKMDKTTTLKNFS